MSKFLLMKIQKQYKCKQINTIQGKVKYKTL